MRKSVKLILIALMIIVLASSLFACGKNPDPPYSGIPDVEIDQGGEESGTVEEVVAVSASPKYLQFIFNEKSLANKNTIVFPIGTTNVSEGYKVFNFDTTNPLISIEVYGDIKYSDKTVKENQRLNIKLTENSTDVLEKFPLIEGYLKNDPQYEDKLKSSGKTVLNVTIPEIYIEGASGHFTKAINLIGQTQIYLAKQHSADSCSITFDGLDTKYFAKEGASFASKISVVKNERINFSKFNATYPVVENKDRPNDSILSYWEVKDDISGNILYYFGINPNPIKEGTPASIENPEINPSIKFVTLFTLDKDVTIKPVFTTNIATVTVEGQEYKYPMGEKIPYDIVGEYTPDAGKVLLGWKNNGEVWDFNNPIVEKDNTLTPILNDKELSLVIYMRGGLFNILDDGHGVKYLPKPADISNVTGTVRSYVSFQKEAPFGVNILTFDGFINNGTNTYGNYKAVTRTEENGVTYDIYLSELLKTFKKDDYAEVILSEDKETFSTTWDPTNVIEKDLVLYAKWDLAIINQQEYDQKLFKDNFTVKADGTIRLDKIEDYYIESLKIPNVYKYSYTYLDEAGKEQIGTTDYVISELGDMMCQNFSGLRSLDLSKTTQLTKIGFRTFANCSQLETITLPETGIEFDLIGEAAFENTKYIKKSTGTVKLGNVVLNSEVANNKLTIEGTNENPLVIAPGAFKGRTDIKQIELNFVKRIESRAFAGCALSKSECVTIDNNIEYVAPDAFEETDYNELPEIKFGNYLFKVNNEKIIEGNYDIPAGITVIGESAFASTPTLKTLGGDIASIKNIYKDAFKDTLFVITPQYISNTTYVDNGFVVVNKILCNYTGREQVVVLPQQLKQIAPYAFSGYNNRDVIDIILPPSITKIGEYAFKDAFSKYKSGRGDARIYILNNSKVDIHPTAFATDYTIVGENNVVKEVKGGLPTYLRFVYSSAVILNDGTELNALYLQELAKKFYKENKLTDYFKNFKVVQEDKDNRFNTDIVKLDFLQDAEEIGIEDIQNEMLGVDRDKKNEIFNAIFLTYKMVDNPDDIGSIAKTSILINNDCAIFDYDTATSTICYKLYTPQQLPIAPSDTPQLKVEQKLNLRHTFMGINETSGVITINLNAPDAPVEITSGPFNSGEEVPYIYENALLDTLKLSYKWKTPETLKESSLTDLGLKNSQIKFVNRISTPDKETEKAQMVLVYEVINYGKNSEKNLTYKFTLDYTIKRVTYTGIALKSANPQNPDIVGEFLKIPVNTSIRNLDPNNFVLTKNDETTTIPNSFNTAGFIIVNVQYDDPSNTVNFADPILRDLGKGFVDALYIVGNTQLELKFKFEVVMRPNLDMFEYEFYRDGSKYFATITGISKDAKGTIMIPATLSYKDFEHNSMIQSAMNACKLNSESPSEDLVFTVTKIDFSKNPIKNLRITEIGMPEDIEEIGDSTFYEWSELYRIGYYTGKLKELTAQDFLEGVKAKDEFPTKLKVIGKEAFYGTKLGEFIINSTVLETIRVGAFKNTPVSNIEIKNATSIEMHAFADCDNLLTVTLPVSGLTINELAFFNCHRLYEVNNVENATLKNGAFTNCPSLYGEGAGYQKCGTDIFDIDSQNVLQGFKPDLGTNIEYFTIPSNVTKIAPNAFKDNKKIKFVVINSINTEIGENAFSGCTALESIVIPASVTTIGGGAFSGCTALKTITIPEGTTTIPVNLFNGCTSLETITIPASITTIGGGAFSGCTSLQSIIIPKAVGTIGAKAFNGCSKLASIEIIGSGKTIEGTAFEGCTNITKLIIPIDYVAKMPKATVREIVINGGTTIETNQFVGYVGLEKVVLGDTVTTISANAFSGCSKLISIELSSSVQTIGEGAFSGCTALKTITIPDGITTISTNMFSGCAALKTIIIPSSVTTIGEGAFNGCAALQTITIPEGITTISTNMFNGCTALKTIIIPSSVTTIGGGAFNGCAALQTIIIPASVTTIEANAFDGCLAITTIEIIGSGKTVADNAFNGCLNVIKLIIPVDMIAKMPKTNVKEIVINGGTTITANQFAGYDSLEKVVLGDTVTTISANAFNGCSTLKTIIIPPSVTTIGGGAFNGCTGLITVTILGNPTIDSTSFDNCPNIVNLTTNANSIDKFTSGKIENLTITGGEIATNACKDKAALKTVTIKEGVTSIGASAFSGCVNLLTIEIADSVETIVSKAFEGCTKLNTVIYVINKPANIAEDAFVGLTNYKVLIKLTK